MVRSTIVVFLYGVALVQALPTSKFVKSNSSFKDWTHEKKPVTKLEDEPIDEIKQGNRTKKSTVVCLEIEPLPSEACAPGCCDQSGLPSPPGSAIFGPNPDGPEVIEHPSFLPLPPSQPPLFPPTHSQFPIIMPTGPGQLPPSTFTFPQPPSITYPTNPQPPITLPSGPGQLPPPSVIFPQPPSITYPTNPQPPITLPSGPGQLPPSTFTFPQPPSITYPTNPQPPITLPSGPGQLPPPSIIFPQPPSITYPTNPQPPITLPSGPGQLPPSTFTFPQPPSITYPTNPQPPITLPSGPGQLPPSTFTFPQPPSIGYSANAKVTIPGQPLSPSIYPITPPGPFRPPSLPQIPNPGFVHPPAIPQLPPCPPGEQYMNPGTESEEVISYEMVPIKHRIPSSPGQITTSLGQPCTPTDQNSQFNYQLPAPPMTTMTQQATLNQLQVVQGNTFAASGIQQYSQMPGHGQIIQLPSPNAPIQNSISAQAIAANSGGAFVHQNQQFGYSGQYGGQPPAYCIDGNCQQPGYPSPAVINSPTIECFEKSPIGNGAFGYQASQNVAQSYVAAQNGAFSQYGLSSFRSAKDSNNETGMSQVIPLNATIPYVQQTENSINSAHVAPSMRYSSYGRRSVDESRYAMPDRSNGNFDGNVYNMPQSEMIVNHSPLKRSFAKRQAESKVKS